MRIVIAAALLAAFSVLTTAPAAADGPASVPQLAPGEVLLEVNGLGMVRSPATLATVTGTAEGRGPTEADARRALAAEVERMTAAARAAGAPAADIRVTPVAVGEAIDTAIYDEGLPGESDEAGRARREARRYQARSTVTVRLREPTRAPALQATFGAAELWNPQQPLYELIDDSEARRTARTRAVAAARTDAESYAAALGMRIVRVLRVTERTGLDFLGMAVSESNRLMQGWRSFADAQAEGQVETYVLTGVDFVLAPR